MFLPKESYSDIINCSDTKKWNTIYGQKNSISRRDYSFSQFQSIDGKSDRKYNLLAVAYKPFPKKPFMLKDGVSGEQFAKYKENIEAIITPASYAGRNKTKENLRDIHALVVDLDLPGEQSWPLVRKYIKDKTILAPDFITFSGTGLHLYYKLSDPIATFGYNFNARVTVHTTILLLQHLLNDKIHNLINKTLKIDREPSHLPLTQGYRLVGSLTKTGKIARGFSPTGLKSKGHSFHELASFVGLKEYDNSLVDYAIECAIAAMKGIKQPCLNSTLNLGVMELAEKTNYKKNKVENASGKILNKLYNPIFTILLDQATNNKIKVGQRYNKLSTLVMAGAKYNVPISKVKEDLRTIREIVVANTGETSFGEDVMSDLYKWYSSPSAKTATYSRICKVLEVDSLAKKKSKSTKAKTILEITKIDGLTQKEIAEKYGVSQSTVSKILSGKISREDRLISTIKLSVKTFAKVNKKYTLKDFSLAVGKSQNTVRKYYKQFRAWVSLEISRLFSENQEKLNTASNPKYKLIKILEEIDELFLNSTHTFKDRIPRE